MTIKQSWLDDAGDILENRGFPPGCIFEAHTTLSPELQKGVVVATKRSDGTPPITVFDISTLFVCDHDGNVQEHSIGWPLFCTRFHLLDWC